MANRFYDLGIEAFLEGGIDAVTDTVKANLLSSASYTPNFTTDEFLADVPGGAVIKAGVALSSKSGTAGTLSASNTTWTSVSGTAAAFIGLYKDTGSSATSNLILLIDTATGLPITPNGGDIAVAWSSGQVFTLFQGLPDRLKEPGLHRRLWEWLNELARIPAKRGPGGLWIPQPSLYIVK